MKYGPNSGVKLPERRGEAPDRADIEDLTYNWELLDGKWPIFGEAQTHIAQRDNPHNVTAAQIGSVDASYVDAVSDRLTQHIADNENPHEVTAAQVGAYSAAEIDALLGTYVQAASELEGGRVIITPEQGGAVVVSVVTAEELESLAGVTGNVQDQLNNISYYNYLPELPIITLSTGGDDFPDQDTIDAQVIPLIEAEYPTPSYRDGIIQNVQTQNLNQRKAILYGYFDGSQSDGFVGWRYITAIYTLVNRADGTVYGVVQDSDDISFVAGQGTVNHSAEADLAEAANGLVTITLPSGADLHTLYDVEHNAVYIAGAGNSVVNKPDGVNSFVMLSQRAAAGHTLHVLYAVESDEFSGLWTEEWNGSTWSAWRNPLGDLNSQLEATQVTNLNLNPNNWNLPAGLAPGVIQRIWGTADTVGNPFNNAWAGIVGGQTSDGDAIILITQQGSSPVGMASEIAWKLWNNNGFYYSPFRAIGANVGSTSNPFGSVYGSTFSGKGGVQLQAFDDPQMPTNQGIVIGSYTQDGGATYKWSARPTIPYAMAPMDLGRPTTTAGLIQDYAFDDGYFMGNVKASSFELNGDTITSWPTGGGGGGVSLADDNTWTGQQTFKSTMSRPTLTNYIEPENTTISSIGKNTKPYGLAFVNSVSTGFDSAVPNLGFIRKCFSPTKFYSYTRANSYNLTFDISKIGNDNNSGVSNLYQIDGEFSLISGTATLEITIVDMPFEPYFAPYTPKDVNTIACYYNVELGTALQQIPVRLHWDGNTTLQIYSGRRPDIVTEDSTWTFSVCYYPHPTNDPIIT